VGQQGKKGQRVLPVPLFKFVALAGVTVIVGWQGKRIGRGDGDAPLVVVPGCCDCASLSHSTICRREPATRDLAVAALAALARPKSRLNSNLSFLAHVVGSISIESGDEFTTKTSQNGAFSRSSEALSGAASSSLQPNPLHSPPQHA